MLVGSRVWASSVVVSGKTDEVRRRRESARVVSKSLVGLRGLSSTNADTEHRKKGRCVEKRVRTVPGMKFLKFLWDI